jgi:multiple sugar transport system ATP-binding protein
MAEIQLHAVSKRFGSTEVLRSVDLSIRPGEFLTLVGPSGCGKSTLLRIVAGLETASEGVVSIGGRDVSGHRASERDLAMVFQSYALYPHLSVRQNMATPLRLRRLNRLQRLPLLGRLMPGAARARREIDGLVDEVASSLKIEHLLERKPGQLSGGQRQRVALGRAMVRKPVAFLMDEPLSNLDAALRVHMRAELSELHRRLGTTFIYVTHDQSEALTMSDRVAVMMDGGILQLGSPETVYESPAHLRVAEFIGSPKINVLPLLAEGGRAAVLGRPLGIGSLRCEPGMHAAIRPEHLRPAQRAAEGSGWRLRVGHRENLGADVFLHGRFEGDDSRVIVRAAPHQAEGIQVGGEVLVTADPAHWLFFDRDGARVTPGTPAAAAPRPAGRLVA